MHSYIAEGLLGPLRMSFMEGDMETCTCLCVCIRAVATMQSDSTVARALAHDPVPVCPL